MLLRNLLPIALVLFNSNVKLKEKIHIKVFSIAFSVFII